MLDELKKYLANNDYATDLSFFKLIFFILRRDRTLKNVENKNLIINEVLSLMLQRVQASMSKVPLDDLVHMSYWC